MPNYKFIFDDINLERILICPGAHALLVHLSSAILTKPYIDTYIILIGKVINDLIIYF